jgi:tRNA uridine 5-carbamoylmethylation protein Kti12
MATARHESKEINLQEIFVISREQIQSSKTNSSKRCIISKLEQKLKICSQFFLLLESSRQLGMIACTS